MQRLARLQVSWNHWLGAGLVAMFTVLAISYSVVTPVGEAPDEVGHFEYVLHLLKTRALPVQKFGSLDEAKQPPLYYLLAATVASLSDYRDTTGQFLPNPNFIWAGKGGHDVNAGIHTTAETFPYRGQALTLHLVRATSAVLGALTIALVVVIGLEIFPERPLIGLLAGAIAAFDPQFLFISGAANNDNLVTTLVTLALWQLIRMLGRPDRVYRWLMVGAIIGAAGLAKPTGFVIGVAAGLVLVCCAVRERSLWTFVRDSLCLVVIIFSIAGWWFVRNQVLYGDPFGWSVFTKVFAAIARPEPLHLSDLLDFVSVQFRSFWAFFGWMNVPAPSWFYKTALGVCFLAGAGVVRALVTGRWARLRQSQKQAVIVLVLAAVSQEGFILWYITHCNSSCYQGRLLFPAIGPLAIMCSSGLLGLTPRAMRLWVSGTVASCFLVAALFMPFKVIRPAYHIIPLPKWATWTIPSKTDAVFGDRFGLLGYRIQEGASNRVITITLYWQALEKSDFDYSVFMHLTDGSERVIAQQDHAPGAIDGYPPTKWWIGDIVADKHTVTVPDSTPAVPLYLRIGVYNYQTGERLPLRTSGRTIGSSLTLDLPYRPG